MIFDLLDAAGVTWKVYNNTWDSIPYGIPITSSSSGNVTGTTNAVTARAGTATLSVAACPRCRGSFPVIGP